MDNCFTVVESDIHSSQAIVESYFSSDGQNPHRLLFTRLCYHPFIYADDVAVRLSNPPRRRNSQPVRKIPLKHQSFLSFQPEKAATIAQLSRLQLTALVKVTRSRKVCGTQIQRFALCGSSRVNKERSPAGSGLVSSFRYKED